MRMIGWIIWGAFWCAVVAVFHYTLPQRDIVYIQGTEIIRQDFSGWNRMFFAQADSGNDGTATNRDLRLINATRANGNVIVYRNEDTGFGWPPYFKLDSSDLHAEAQGAISTRNAPDWYLLTHYGWRNELLSIYPNAVNLRPIEGPDVGKPLPWVNIVILTLCFILFYSIRVRWLRFRRARLDPAFEEIQDNLEATSDSIAARGARLRRWLRSRQG